MRPRERSMRADPRNARFTPDWLDIEYGLSGILCSPRRRESHPRSRTEREEPLCRNFHGGNYGFLQIARVRRFNISRATKIDRYQRFLRGLRLIHLFPRTGRCVGIGRMNDSDSVIYFISEGEQSLCSCRFSESSGASSGLWERWRLLVGSVDLMACETVLGGLWCGIIGCFVCVGTGLEVG